MDIEKLTCLPCMGSVAIMRPDSFVDSNNYIDRLVTYILTYLLP